MVIEKKLDNASIHNTIKQHMETMKTEQDAPIRETIVEVLNTELSTKEKDSNKPVSPVTRRKIVEVSLAEQRERESRMANLIVTRLVEPIEVLKDKVIQQDREQFIKICKEINVNIEEDEVLECKRIGKKNETEGRYRPLLITLKESKLKSKIFKNLREIKNTPYKEVKISNDLTKLQRETHQQLWDEAKEKSAQDQSGNTYYRVVGPPWNWMVKLFKKA